MAVDNDEKMALWERNYVGRYKYESTLGIAGSFVSFLFCLPNRTVTHVPWRFPLSQQGHWWSLFVSTSLSSRGPPVS
jgi:hypothetical protein